ncbi:helix-turn-helix domain-containing protein [Corynebacterium suranareeae]|uniref:helix-turn-helix domain-containing protein n=1 Tax=Corynebacterium suranareeae TaxID=2506452 RepID=UPI0038B97975
MSGDGCDTFFLKECPPITSREQPTTQEAVRRIADGQRVKDVAVDLGIHPSTIYLALKRHGVPVGKNAPHRVLNPQTNRHVPNPTERPATKEAVTRVQRGERVVTVAKKLPWWFCHLIGGSRSIIGNNNPRDATGSSQRLTDGRRARTASAR